MNFVSKTLQVYLEGRKIAEERILQHYGFVNPFIISQDYANYLICTFSVLDLCSEKEIEIYNKSKTPMIERLKLNLSRHGNCNNNGNNYYYLRELRNAFTHRGLTFSLFQPFQTNKICIPISPPSIKSRSSNRSYFSFTNSLIESYQILENEMMPLVKEFLYDNNFLPEQYDEIFEMQKNFLEEESNYSSDLKDLILQFYIDSPSLQGIYNESTDRFNDKIEKLLLPLKFSTN